MGASAAMPDTPHPVLGPELFDHMIEAVGCYRPDGTIIYLNSVASRVLGQSAATLVGKSLWDVVPDSANGPFRVLFEETVRSGASQHLERFYPPWGRWFLNRLYLAGGKVWIIGRDITADKASMARIEILATASRVFSEATPSDASSVFPKIARHVAELLNDLCSVRLLSDDGQHFEQPLGIWDTDPDVRRLLDDTPAAGTSEAIGAEILHTRRSVLITHIDPDAAAARIAPSPRRDLVARLGIHSVMVVPMTTQGQLIGIVSACRRLTGTRAAYDQADLHVLEDLAMRASMVVGQWRALRRADESHQRLVVIAEERERILVDLRAAVAARDEFLSIASHELRTPLTSLDLQLSGIERSLIKDPQQPVDKLRRRIATATRQTDRLKALIDGLLDVSRIEMGRLQLEPADVDVGDLVREVVERADADAARAGSTITAQLPVTVAARVDRMRIDQVLTNLLSNAIKYGGGKPIEVSLGEDGDQLSLAVRDHGVGIAAQDLTRIFGRFERAVESSHYGGLGLGLYIANQMVIAHGGTIVASSPPGQGATFTIRIPRRT
jgi:PAS domain S-box-containing protein